MGLKRAYPEALIFFNKNISSSFIYGLQFNIGMCCFVIVKALPLSIDFSTTSLSFPSEVNHSPKQDLGSLASGLECSLGFL